MPIFDVIGASPTPWTRAGRRGSEDCRLLLMSASRSVSSSLVVGSAGRASMRAKASRAKSTTRAHASSLAAGPPSPSRKVRLVPDRLWESLSKLHEHRPDCNERPEEPKEHAAAHGIILRWRAARRGCRGRGRLPCDASAQRRQNPLWSRSAAPQPAYCPAARHASTIDQSQRASRITVGTVSAAPG